MSKIKFFKILLLVYLFLNVIGCISGYIDSKVTTYGVSECNSGRRSIFIGYSIGCYIGTHEFYAENKY